MFSPASTSLRKSSLSIHRLVVAAQWLNRRPFFAQSQRSTPFSPSSSSSSSGFGHGDGKTRGSGFNAFMGSVFSGFFIVGSSIGVGYCYSSFLDANCFLSFADYRGEATQAVDDDDRLRQSEPEKKSNFLFGDAYRKRVFFKYEKRIRMQSPPEKVFDYFASIRTPAGEVFMTPADLMRAVVPVFPPSESNRIREGFLRGERVPGELNCAPSKFFMLFDTNNDGLISFPEYIFFVTLLSIPESSFSVAFKMFDIDNNGGRRVHIPDSWASMRALPEEIDREEFRKVMALMRSQNRQVARHSDGRRLGHKVSVENGGLLEYFFGSDGKSSLKHERFVQFLRDLHNEILRLEFSHYDYNTRGTISATDFALSLVASADVNHINKLLDQVDEINKEPDLKDIFITFEEFKQFAELRKQLQPFSLAIFSFGKVNGVLTKKDFQRAASQVCGIRVTDNVVNIIFHVFDANRDGNLSVKEFVRVLQRREIEFSDSGPRGGLISCWLSCAANSSKSKWHI